MNQFVFSICRTGEIVFDVDHIHELGHVSDITLFLQETRS